MTLWEVDDAAAPQITPPFFAAMHAGKLSAAQALRRAKLAMIASSQARFRHPYAWGPSVIFGDGDRPDDPYEAGQFVLEQLKPAAVILAKGSQNGVFAEEALKPLLKNSADASKLVRQSTYWLKQKQAQFGKP